MFEKSMKTVFGGCMGCLLAIIILAIAGRIASCMAGM